MYIYIYTIYIYTLYIYIYTYIIIYISAKLWRYYISTLVKYRYMFFSNMPVMFCRKRDLPGNAIHFQRNNLQIMKRLGL